MPEPALPTIEHWPDLQPLLDQELERLPANYRAAIVVCDLEGETHRVAAKHLGCPVGTLSARLTRARKLLAQRLGRRGLSLSVGALGALLAEQATEACVPQPLLAATSEGAVAYAVGSAAATQVSASAIALAEGVVRAMLLTRLKVLLGLLVVVSGLLAAGLGVRDVLSPISAAEPPAAAHPKKAAERLSKERQLRLLRWQIDFDSKDGNDYVKQLEVLGAILALPTDDAHKHRVIRDLAARPLRTTVEDLSKSEHIFWIESNPRTLKSVAQALGLGAPPEHVIVFLPRYIEDELLRKELAHARCKDRDIHEEDIAETEFKFRRTQTGYEITVASQRLAR
jgi:hypothetical protein